MGPVAAADALAGRVDPRRVRLLDAVAEVVAEQGLQAASVTAVCRRASVSRAVFNELFTGLDDCFLELVDRTLRRMTDAICLAAERERSWDCAIVAALAAMVRFLDREEVATRACLTSRAAAGPEALESRAAMLERLTAILDGARDQLEPERQPPAVMAEATALSLLGILRRRLLRAEAPPFTPMLGQLVEAAVAPYLGPADAARLAREAQERVNAPAGAGDGADNGDGNEEAYGARVRIPDMLCHARAHRMRACLLHLAAHPGASNRAIGERIGVAHPGQISALLARLHGAGLLEKEPGGAGRPNAWSLSPLGVAVTRALAGA